MFTMQQENDEGVRVTNIIIVSFNMSIYAMCCVEWGVHLNMFIYIIYV